jgi:hypothetical protein
MRRQAPERLRVAGRCRTSLNTPISRKFCLLGATNVDLAPMVEVDGRGMFDSPSTS